MLKSQRNDPEEMRSWYTPTRPVAGYTQAQSDAMQDRLIETMARDQRKDGEKMLAAGTKIITSAQVRANARRERVLGVLSVDGPGLTAVEIRELIGFSRKDGLGNDMRDLRRMGLIRRTGRHTHKMRYFLASDGQ